MDERAVNQSGATVVAVTLSYFLPPEVETLLDDPSYAHERLECSHPSRITLQAHLVLDKSSCGQFFSGVSRV